MPHLQIFEIRPEGNLNILKYWYQIGGLSTFAVDVAGAKSVNAAGSQAVDVAGAQSVNAAGAQAVDVAGGQAVDVGKAQEEIILRL